jgi:hypothetical protein
MNSIQSEGEVGGMDLMQVRRVLVQSASEIASRYSRTPSGHAVHEAMEALMQCLDDCFHGRPPKAD